MRGCNFWLFSMVMYCFSANAQQNFELHGAFYAGANLTNLSGMFLHGLNPGFTIGNKVELVFKRRFSAELQLQYSMKGDKWPSVDANLNTVQRNLQLHYVEMPLMLNFYLGQHLSIGGGASYGYLFWYKDLYDEKHISFTQGLYNRMDISYLIALNYYFHPRWGVQVLQQQSVEPLAYGLQNSVFSIRLNHYFYPRNFEDFPIVKIKFLEKLRKNNRFRRY